VTAQVSEGAPRRGVGSALLAVLGRDGVNSAITWLILVVFLVAVRVLVDAFYPDAFNDPEQASFFAWPSLAIIAILGLVGVYFSHLTQFPAAWSMSAPVSRWLSPVAVGILFGVGYVVLDQVTSFTVLNNAHHGVTTQFVGVVPAILIFSGGAIISEVVFRLFPIPLLLWIISRVILRKRWAEPVFWGLAILTSLLEPVSQFSFLLGSTAAVGIVVVFAGFAFNMVQAGFFRRYGFLTAITVRVAFYLIWHVAYVH
jgi:hypothetical protein